MKLTETSSAAASTGTYLFNNSTDLTQVYDVNITKRLTASAYLLASLWDTRTDLIDTWGDIDNVGAGAHADRCDAVV